MQRLRDYVPALKYGAKVYPNEIAGMNAPLSKGKVLFVDGDKSTGGAGSTWEDAYSTIQGGIDAASAGDLIMVAEKKITDYTGDPTSYAETLIIPANKPHLTIMGVSRGLTQGGLPQIKKGSGSTALLSVRAAGCLIANLGFNGVDSTGGGILLDDDYSTKTAFGTSIVGCHFKNCVGTTATNAATGGAVMWTSAGNAWQVRIAGNRFYKNVGDIVVKGTSNTVPQDVVIEDNIFSGPAASVDCNIYTGGSGVNGLIIKNNYFQADPAIGSASNGNFLMLTGSVGLLANNFFACITEEADTEITFGAAGVNKVPTTVFMAGNYGEWGTAGATGVGSGEIFRT